jgi:MFS family permease
MTNYAAFFSVALLINAVVTFRSSGLWKRFRGVDANSSDTVDLKEQAKHTSLLRRYLAVYLLATLSDWLQGPYVYALYDAYGYSQHDIAILFVAGFGSSMVFGSFVGGMADWGGRRRFVILFTMTYAASCLTKHFNDFNILMLGRLLGGVATSLLFSVFEAWLIRSHSDAKISKQQLSNSFSTASYGNSIIAIIAGLLANKAASATDMKHITGVVYIGGFLNPFDIALVALVSCGMLASTFWDENYGHSDAEDNENSSDDGRSAPNWYDGLKNAFIAASRSRDILLCGIISSLFEGSMYIFVFMWTPALTALMDKKEGDGDVKLPFGVIFSTFMVCCMAGSSLFSILIGKFKAQVVAVGVFAVASIAMGMVAFSSSGDVAFSAMNLFEMCVGMYFPVMGTMKGAIVPEDKRAAIYNLYRIPLNFIVLFSLLTDLTPKQSFQLNCSMLSVATVLQIILMKRRSLHDEQEEKVPSEVREQEAVPLSTDTEV